MLRVGGDEPVPVDVRVIAATNRDPEQAVAEGKLREDLLLPPERVPDRAAAAARARGRHRRSSPQHFLDALNEAEGTHEGIRARRARSACERHDWPGNVRELKNVVQRAFILADEEIDRGCLPAELGAAVMLDAAASDGTTPALQASARRSAKPSGT